MLNELHARLDRKQIHYWRDKRGHEVDFILHHRKTAPVAVECKWNSVHFEPDGIAAFRRIYGDGVNLVVAGDVAQSYKKHFGDLEVEFHSADSLIAKCGKLS